jgi:excinuclease ABC subunit B
VIIVASVSCIYGLGSPEYYRDISMQLAVGQKISREEISKELIEMQYLRTDVLGRSKFRMTGDTIEVMSPAREIVTRIELQNGKVYKIFEYDFLTGSELGKLEQVLIFPAKHFVVPEPIMQEAQSSIEKDLEKQLAHLKKAGKLLEAERLSRRTRQDIEMMREIGYCNGIENYSRYLTGRNAGEAPDTLIDYFPASTHGDDRLSTRGWPKDFLMVVDESHVTIPQIGGMFNGDFSRKKSLVDNGFRLPSAFDNRPLKFSEFESKLNQVIFTSATPSKYEFEKSQIPNQKSQIKNPNSWAVEQIIRPTGLIDPEIVIKPAKGQVKDVLVEIEKVVAKKERVLITTLTKKMAEDLSEFLLEHKIKTEYLHSGVDTLDRIRILENLRRGEFDVLVGVNLLREGLDLPEVSLVAILDADKEGFLRSETSLIQTIGRAARNVSGRVLLYADKITGSMQRAIGETDRRRAVQMAYNKKHHITPQTIKKNIESIVDHEIKPEITRDFAQLESLEDIQGYIKQKEREMKAASKALQFEKAALIRDEISQLRKLQLK